MKYAFIDEQRRSHRVRRLCHVLGVSRSGYYDWMQRGPSARAQGDRQLLEQIRRVHREHRGHSGALKTWRVLRSQDVDCGKHRVARLRREHDIVARRRRRFVLTTRSKRTHWQAPNLLERNLRVDQPKRAWVGDVTFVPTRQGWLYLSVLIDLYSRQVVGWSMHKRNDVELALAALDMALTGRCPQAGLIHHTDQGAVYAAKTYQQRLQGAQLVPSMSRKGDCWDNAVAESFFATLEFELIERRTFATRANAQSAIFEFIEVFYNRQRAHQTLAYKTPIQVEAEYGLVA